ncbi:MAG: pseudouridine synthase, partial [Burkholderia gladioli]
RSGEGRPPRDGDRPRFGDRPPRDGAPRFSRDGDRPQRSSEGRPPRDGDRPRFGDRPPRDGAPRFSRDGDRPQRSSEGRSPRDGDRPRFGDRPPRDGAPRFSRDGDRPQRSSDGRPPRDGDRPRFGDRPPRDGAPRFSRDGDRPQRSSEGRPPRDGDRPRFGDRPPRDGAPRFSRDGDRPQRSSEGRPPRDGDRPRFGDRPPREGGARFSRDGDRPQRSGEGRPPRGDARPAHLGERAPREDGARFARNTDRPARAPRDADAPSRIRTAQPVKAPAPSFEDADETGMMRLSKRMSELGLCSRREADEWIEKGWVLVDGERIDTLGTKVRPDQKIEIDDRAQAAQAAQVTILLHKPVGYVSGQAEDGYEPAVTLITRENQWSGDHSPLRFSPMQLRALAPAGRLDIDSTGMLVLTQNGVVAKQLIGENSDVDKEYLVRVRFGEQLLDIDQTFPAEQLAKLRHGLELDGVALKPALVSWQNGEQLRFVLREGKKRQIRRMCELVGLEVIGLKRVRMGRVMLGALPQGEWRYLSPDETF